MAKAVSTINHDVMVAEDMGMQKMKKGNSMTDSQFLNFMHQENLRMQHSY